MDSVAVEDDEMMHEKHLFMGTKFEGEQLTKDVDHHVCVWGFEGSSASF